MIGSNVINVLKGGSAKAFLLVTDNRRSRLDSPFCVITQHRKFEFGHYRQSKKIRNAQEPTKLLSQTLFSGIAQIKVSNSPITHHTKKILPQRLPPFFSFCITCFPALFFFLWLLLFLKKDFERLIDVFLL